MMKALKKITYTGQSRKTYFTFIRRAIADVIYRLYVEHKPKQTTAMLQNK